MDPENCQKYARMTTWDECIGHLFDTREFSDFSIIVGSGPQQTVFAVHRLILCISSPVIKSRSCDSKESSISILITDAEPKDVKLMISHMYKRKIRFESLDQTLNVLALAIEYGLSLLEEICTNHIGHLIQADNVCSVYQRTISMGQVDLSDKSFQFIKKHTSSVLKHTELKTMSCSTLEAILKQEYLNVDCELILLNTLIDWGKEQLKMNGQEETSENLRGTIDPFLKYIRFLCLKQEEFAEIQREAKIFSKEEVCMILMNFTIADSDELPTWFNDSKALRLAVVEAKPPDTKPKELFLRSWSNINNSAYSHSERVGKITTKFVGTGNGFFIRRVMLTICENCFELNKGCKRQSIEMKIGITVGDFWWEASSEIRILSGHFSKGPARMLSVDEKDPPLILRKYFDPQKLITRKYVGMEAPILRNYLDPDTMALPKLVDMAPPFPSITVDVMPLIYIGSGEVFALSVETIDDESTFYCCKKKPLFDESPFCVYGEDGVWCAFASIDCFASDG